MKTPGHGRGRGVFRQLEADGNFRRIDFLAPGLRAFERGTWPQPRQFAAPSGGNASRLLRVLRSRASMSGSCWVVGCISLRSLPLEPLVTVPIVPGWTPAYRGERGPRPHQWSRSRRGSSTGWESLLVSFRYSGAGSVIQKRLAYKHQAAGPGHLHQGLQRAPVILVHPGGTDAGG